MKTVLITGSTSGIGFSTAEIFGKEKYHVICHGRSEESDFSIVQRIIALGGSAESVHADLEYESEIRKMFLHISSLDVCINNAGHIPPNRNSISSDVSDFKKTYAINAIAPYLCSMLAHERGATSIVMTGSMRGLQNQATSPAYSASKAALHSLTVSLAKSLAPECRVNAVAPGFTETKVHTGHSERLSHEASKSLLQKTASPQDIAEILFFLASQKSQSLTGQVILADEGRILGG